jgi:AcrR family transcriptional regulator
VDEAQRTRVLEAMAETMAEHGLDVAIGDVISRAGVSSGAFHEAFPDREACLLATVELGIERAQRAILPAYDVEPRWLDAIKAALASFLVFIEREPAIARVLVVYSMSAGERVLRRRIEVLEALAAAVDLGRHERPVDRRQPPAVIAEGVVGAVLAVLQNRLLSDAQADVTDLFGSLVNIVVLPYLGAGVARRELTRPMPRVRFGAGIEPPDAGHDERPVRAVALTYRTALVLRSIADYPGASNREIAERAGIVDQGQVSRLLGRLHSRGLIAKDREPQARGAPNSWRLTEQGKLALRGASGISRA